MDTRVSPTPVNPQDDTKEAGASYAHAVLNFKQPTNNNNNKENIAEPPKQMKDNQVQAADISKQPEEPKHNIEEEESFTPVVSHSRKDRKNEKLKKKLAATAEKGDHTSKDKLKEPRSKEKRDERESAAVKEVNDEQGDVRKIFVEAPIPKVNPWQVKQVAPTNPKEENTQPEKRVLQPKKQEITVNGSEVSGVVKAPKDKRRYNQKAIVLVAHSSLQPESNDQRKVFPIFPRTTDIEMIPDYLLLAVVGFNFST